MAKKRALITGITGQDGSYLAEFLLKKGYEVFGFERRVSKKNRSNIEHIEERINFIPGDMLDSNSIIRAILDSKPDEIYNLAAQSFVAESWRQKRYTHEVNSSGVINLLEAICEARPETRVYQAGTSEMFGKVQETPQKETTPFYPRSPYGIAKLAAHWTIVNFRESYDIFACSGILFNHESSRRGLEFVTRKITNSIARIKLGLLDKFYLGNIDAKRDWGYAGDYVRAMWLMLQQDYPDDFVIATGKIYKVRDFVEKSFEVAGISVESNGKRGVQEKYIRKDTGKVVLEISPEFFRPAEVDLLVGDSSKARKKLDWQPKVSFEELVEMMVESDLKKINQRR
ncbi:MAG: GDP-mannose 4,6-dehydratase [Candidatus Marinimicrobia bacterium]|nr:GDP-mannose 4,6-dehydratase [Candidatus Neomarinimicrobiota bacterium]